MSDVPPKTASLHFVVTQLKIARWLPNEKSGTPGGWTQRGINRLRWLAEALRSNGINDAKRASQWMKRQFAIGFFPPDNDPGAESMARLSGGTGDHQGDRCSHARGPRGRGMFPKMREDEWEAGHGRRDRLKCAMWKPKCLRFFGVIPVTSDNITPGPGI